jgi:hypothetical protein
VKKGTTICTIPTSTVDGEQKRYCYDVGRRIGRKEETSKTMPKGEKDRMRRNKWIVFGGVVAALVLAAALGAQSVYADTGTPPVPPDERGAELQGQPRPPRLGPEGLEVAAEALGMTTDELSAELKAGSTLEDIATEKGVDIEVVRAAIQAAHKAQMLKSINQAVADEKMTQDKADWLLIGLEKGYLDGPGFGFGPGMGPGGPRPPRGPAEEGIQVP